MEKCIYNLQLGIRFQIVKKINIEKILLTQMMLMLMLMLMITQEHKFTRTRIQYYCSIGFEY